MKIQSASIDVPGGCPNKCAFCVSNLTKNNKPFMKDYISSEDVSALYQYRERLEFLRENGVSTLVLTGTSSEPAINVRFLSLFKEMNDSLSSKFRNIEIQTSGICLDKARLSFLEDIGVKTISISLSSLDSDLNNKINGIPQALQFNIADVVNHIKKAGLNIRLSLNINKEGFPSLKETQYPVSQFLCENKDRMLSEAKNLGIIDLLSVIKNLYDPDQLTFRKLYYTREDTPENKWIKENTLAGSFWSILNMYLEEEGRVIQKLPFGAMKMSYLGMSVVVDTDCMSQNTTETLKYAILRRNCKLYSDWSDTASLIF